LSQQAKAGNGGGMKRAINNGDIVAARGKTITQSHRGLVELREVNEVENTTEGCPC